MPEASNTVLLVATWGFLIGLSLGVTLIYTRFCTMGAVADIALSGNYARMRAWMLALVVALVGTQLCHTLIDLPLNTTSYLQPSLSFSGTIVGGGLFGFGMVIACGCGARSLAMAGSGDLRALVAIIILGISAYITIRGILSPVGQWLLHIGSLDTQDRLLTPSLSALVSETLETSKALGQLLATAFICLPLLYFIAYDRSFWHSYRRVAAGIWIGLLIVLAWLATGYFVVDDFDEVPLQSLTFVAPIGSTLQYLMLWSGSSVTFSIASVLGVLAGSLVAALARGEWMLRGFEDAREMLRYMGGGALMGIGGVLAGGCTFGQGLTGLSTLSLGAMLALVSIICGAFIGIRYLELGSFISIFKMFYKARYKSL